MLVWSYWPVQTGGAEGQCRKLSLSLADRNIRCTVLTARLQLDISGRDKDGAVDIVRIPVPAMWIERIIAWRDKRRAQLVLKGNVSAATRLLPKYPATNANLLNRMVRWMNILTFILGATIWLLIHKRTIDVIHVHIGDWLAGFAGWIGARLDVPVVCKAANMPVFTVLDVSIPFRRTWENWRRKIYYVAMHQAIRDELVGVGVEQEKIRIIANGVEVQIEKAEPSEGISVLFVGNFSQGAAHKGFDVLFRAWKMIWNENPYLRLLMVGKGDTAPWQDMVNRLGCEKSVHFVGYVQTVEDLYRNSAVFVLPSRHEGMSNALLEAQAWGLPAIVSDIPGNRAVVNHGVTGLIVPVGDHEALASAILSLLNEPERRSEMGLQARKRILEHFAMDRITEKYCNLYADLVSQVHLYR